MSTPIKKIPASFVEGLENINRIPSATYEELGITPESTLSEKQTVIANFLEGYNVNTSDVLFFEIKETPIYNFDVTANWSSVNVTNVTNFQNFLATRYKQIPHNSTNIVITDFNLNGGRLRCNLTATGTNLDLSYTGLISIKKIGNIVGLQKLWLNNNTLTLTSFELSTLPDTLEEINMVSNKITNIAPMPVLPPTLQLIDIRGNAINDWSSFIPWAESLPDGTSSTIIKTEGNPVTANGTEFLSILQTKGYSVTV